MDDRKTKPRDRRMRWLLGGSIALNLLFVGAFAGAAYRGGESGGGRAAQGDATRGYAAPYVRALPREDRKAMFRALRQEQKAGPMVSRKERRAMHERMVTVLRTTPFDAQLAERVLTEQRDAELSVQSVAQTLWLKTVTEMDATARASYADALEKALKRGPRRHGAGVERDG